MQHRQQGVSQEAAAAKVGISVCSGRRIEKSPSPRQSERGWRTREDPLAAVWSTPCVSIVVASSDLPLIADRGRLE